MTKLDKFKTIDLSKMTEQYEQLPENFKKLGEKLNDLAEDYVRKTTIPDDFTETDIRMTAFMTGFITCLRVFEIPIITEEFCNSDA